jgi:hypothetical protein
MVRGEKSGRHSEPVGEIHMDLSGVLAQGALGAFEFGHVELPPELAVGGVFLSPIIRSARGST